jgi:hypothetical protein
MSDNKSSQYKRPYPDVLRNRLHTLQLLPDEKLEDFFELFVSLEDYLKPQTSWDYLVTYQATTLTFDILRYHEMKVGVLRNHRRPAFESLIHKIHVRRAMKGNESVARTEANQFATQWFSDPASRPAIVELFEKAGYPPNAVEVEAFQLALPTLVPIERLIVSAQKRLDQYLKGVEKTSKASAEALRVAAAKAIDAHASGQPLAS